VSSEQRRAEPADRMCPSTPAGNATVFLGMITAAARVAYVTPEMPAATVLSEVDDTGKPLEARYRFAGPCVTSKCGFWTGEHCGLGARLVESFPASRADPVTDLPRCAIRRTCRWFAEQGPAACSPCSHVVTDAR